MTGAWPRRPAGRGARGAARAPLAGGACAEAGVRGAASPAHPLMSLRTLALPGGPHVKTSLSARLTSSVRDISLPSVAASAMLSDFAETPAARTGRPAARHAHPGRRGGRFPGLRGRPAGVARRRTRAAVSGSCRWRRSPPPRPPRSPAWLAGFTRLALTVGLRLLELGVALEAHGQNLLVVLSPDGDPLRLVYRDLADIRVSPARLARTRHHGAGAARPYGHRRRTRAAPQAVRLARGGRAGRRRPGRARRSRRRWRRPYGICRAPATWRRCARDPLPTKALTLMRLSPQTPGDQWADLPNPLA